jgi:hypothetical protein
MLVRIYSKEGKIFVESDGKILNRITEVELKLDAEQKDPKILYVTYHDKDVQQVFTKDNVKWIDLHIRGGYSIVGSGINPIIMYDGKILDGIQKVRFVTSYKNPIGFLELTMTAIL